jgi:hypothetical protein
MKGLVVGFLLVLAISRVLVTLSAMASIQSVYQKGDPMGMNLEI